jgi:hypothetical protein
MGIQARSLRACVLLTILAGPAFVLTFPAQGQPPPAAEAVLERWEHTSIPSRLITEIPAILPPEVGRDAARLLGRGKPHLVAVTAPPAETPKPGVAWYRLRGAAVELDEATFEGLTTPSFQNKVLYLILLQQLAGELKALPGPLYQGAAQLAAADFLYRTDRAFSSEAKEEAAAYYLLQALNGGASLGLAPASDTVRPLLSRLYAGRSLSSTQVDAALRYLLDPPPAVVPSPEGRNAVHRPEHRETFALLRVLAPEATDEDLHAGRFSAACRESARQVLAQVEGRPDAFAHLPARYRLVRACWLVAYGRDPIVAARKRLNLDVAEADDAGAIAARTAALRRRWRAWFEDEVGLRGKHPGSALRSRDAVYFDPHALAGLAELYVLTSEPFATRLLVPLADDEDLPTAALQEAVRAALHDDDDLRRLFDEFGRPEATVREVAAPQAGKVFELHWTLSARGPDGKEATDHVWLQALNGAPSGGSGKPTEPGILEEQRVPTRTTIAAPGPADTLWKNIGESSFVEAIVGLTPGEDPPPKRTRWYLVAGKRRFAGLPAVRLTMGAQGTLTGTASQEVWCRPAAGRRFGWVPLGDARVGDLVAQLHGGACPVTGFVRVRPAPGTPLTYVRPTLAGADHASANGFVVRTEYRPLPEQSRHGLLAETPILVGKAGAETTVPIGRLEVDASKRRFVRLPGYSTLTAQVHRRDDLLILLTPDRIDALHRIVYQIPGEAGVRSIGVGHSHGFCVKGREFPVAAHELSEGDELVRDEKDVPPAKVVAVLVEECPVGNPWRLIHPKLLRCTWIHANGILTHTDQRDAQVVGLVEGSRIAVTTPPADASARYQVAGQPAIERLAVADPARPDARVDLLLTADAGASVSLSKTGEFMPQAVAGLERAITADLVEITTAGGKKLRCAAGTDLWRQSGPEHDRRTPIQSVAACELHRGDRVVALAVSAGDAALAFDLVSGVEVLDAFTTHPDLGYAELYRLRLFPSSIPMIARHQADYQNVFAEGLMVSLATRPKEQLDLWTGFHGTGHDSGNTPGQVARQVVGPFKPVIPARSLDRALGVSSNLGDPLPEPPLEFSPADRAEFQRSLEALRQAVEALLARGVRPPADPRRWERFAAACLADGDRDADHVLSADSLRGWFETYTSVRQFLLDHGKRSTLGPVAGAGWPFAYLLLEAGGPEAGRLAVADLLTLQMRLCLRKELNTGLWRDETARVRDTVRFAIEFESLADAGRGAAARLRTPAQRFWDVGWAAPGWSDLLADHVALGHVHPDVLARTPDGRQEVVLWNLALQLDHRAGRRQRLTGFLHHDFEAGTEFEGEIRARYETTSP